MELPDGRPLIVADGILAEPRSSDGRLVLWLPDGPRCWDRVGTVAHAEVASGHGLRWVAATATRAQERSVGPLGRLLGGLGRTKSSRSWTLPGGGSAEPIGERRADLALAWPGDDATSLDEARVRARWPRARDCRSVGPALFLVSGVEPPPRAPDAPSPEDSPVMLAERSLSDARESGDPRRLATALADLGLARLLLGDAPGAAATLEEAVAAARPLGDPAREADALSSLALAALNLGQPARARDLLAPALELARTAGDRHAERAILDRLGRALAALGDHALALAHFEQALSLSAAAGDPTHEAAIHWAAAVSEAELGRRDRAASHAKAAVDLFRRLGDPKADWYAHHLANFRSGDPAAPPSAVATGSYFGGSIDASPAAPPPTPGSSGSGPGLLRMAVTATKSMAQFLGSGFRTASPDTYRARLATCASCEHHTGVRCRVCGCFTAAKARLDHERCPLGKWPT